MILVNRHASIVALLAPSGVAFHLMFEGRAISTAFINKADAVFEDEEDEPFTYVGPDDEDSIRIVGNNINHVDIFEMFRADATPSIIDALVDEMLGIDEQE